MIEGVIIKRLEKYSDERGWLSEIWRIDEIPYSPAMGYVSQTNPGVSRGPHEHKNQSDGFVFLGPGDFKLYLWENRQDNVDYRKLFVFDAGEKNPCFVLVPPGVVHGYKCVSDCPAFSINIPNALYKGEGKKEEVDEIRWENDQSSPFKIE